MARRPLTIRARLTLVFAVATAAVLLVIGLAVYLLFSAGAAGTIDRSLKQRQRALRLLAAEETKAGELRAESGERLLQIFSPDGTLLSSTRLLGARPVLSDGRVRQAARAPFGREQTLPVVGESRIRAFAAAKGRWVVVIAEPLDGVHALRLRLAILLALALPVGLLIAGYPGYRLAEAALRPVERMRLQAAQITDSNLTDRLPVADTDDELSRLGATFNALLDRLAGAFARERRIVSDASHELRTPLAILSTELQVAIRPDRSWEQLHEAARSALDETRRLSRLADDLLILARSDEGRLPLRPDPIDVGTILHDLERRNRATVADGDRALETHVDIDGGAVVLADPDRVAQALDNLVANGLRHGAGTIEVHAAAGPAGTVELSVLDHGKGFGAHLPRAFERFSQGDRAHGGSGSGLGLSIVEAIARAHGGSVRAEDAPGAGARVTIALPEA